MFRRILARRRAVACYEQGKAALDRDDPDLAIACFREAIRLDPGYDGGFSGRGLAFLKKFCFPEAIADFSDAIRLNPARAFNYYGRSLCYQGAEVHRRARAGQEEALRLDPAIDRPREPAVRPARGVAVPTLLRFGGKSPPIFKSVEGELMRVLPEKNRKLVIPRDVGHGMPPGHPGPDRKEILAFLKGK
jgi:tetratricopeptide (TPR) repeat protein